MSRKTSLRLVAIAYLGTLLVWLTVCLAGFAGDTIARAGGKMETRSYTFEDMLLNQMGITGENTAITSSNDPWGLLAINGKVRCVQADFTFSGHPGEVNIYYTTGDEPFSDRQKIWGAAQNGGTYKFLLNGQYCTQLRIDPCTMSGMTVTLHSLTVNPDISFFSYFAVDGENVFHFLVYPGVAAALAAALLVWLGVTDEKIASLWAKVKARLPHKQKKQ